MTNSVRALAGSRLFVQGSEIGGNIRGQNASAVQVAGGTQVGAARKYARFVRRKATTWGHNWREMFKEIGHERTYLDDYSFL